MTTLLRGLASLPLAALQVVGGMLGVLAYVVSKKYRGHLRANLSVASRAYGFSPHYWRAAVGAGQTMTDALWILQHHQEALRRTVIGDWSLVDEALLEGKGLMILSPHLGSFEIIPPILAERFPTTILRRPHRQPWLEAFAQPRRAHEQLTFVPANLQGVRSLARALVRHEVVATMPDQVPRVGDGVWAPFFGRPAYTTVLAMKIAARHNTPTIMFAAIRRGLGRGWEVRLTRLHDLGSGSMEAAAVVMNRALEEAILQAPQQYLWAYNRYRVPRGVTPP